MDLSRYAALFLTESREHLRACNQLLLDWEREPRSTEPAAGIFRAMHTFKGMSAAMGYGNLTELAHRAETVLDVLRSDPGSATPEVHDLLFRIVDALEAGAPEAVAGGDGALDFTALLSELDQASVATAPTGSWAIPKREQPPAPAPVGRTVRVSIRTDAAMRGARALLAVRRAESLGRVTAVRPPLSAFEHEDFDGQLSFRLESERDAAALIESIRSVGDVESVVFGDDLAERPSRETGDAVGRSRQIRVDLRRLDAMMTQVGELVVAKGRLSELVALDASPEMQAIGARIGRVVSELQGEIIQARMTPVWQVFDRFPRVVRDLARQLGKRVTFEVEGEEIELDRTILDEIGDPLLHLLRNAVDHGIEPPAERQQRHKPAEGRIKLSATRERTSVAVRVSDDGRGIDRERILEKAIRDGLVDAGTEALQDDVLLRILSRPGFTTAAMVTDVSGRGVGMDAVFSRVRALGGSIDLESTPGSGATFTLRLPMTLAIVRALLTRVGTERYAIPLASVAETVELHPASLASLQGREALVLRERVIPTIRLRECVGMAAANASHKYPAIILEVGDRRAALVVDALMGQQEIVVEPFDAPKGMLPIFSGATILGDGVPVLIVDPAALV
ncbi:MAG: chemotaxis protein CheA [Gemmatimonadota bacterium]